MAMGLGIRRELVIDRRWDVVFIVSFVFIVMAAAVLTQELFAGDWSFWTDWKDRQFWPLAAPAVAFVIPAALQFIAWKGLRLPIGATVGAVCLFLAEWINRIVQFHGFGYFPTNFVWPETFILAAVLVDIVLMWSRSYLLTSFVGGMLWGLLFWPQQFPMLAPFLEPVNHFGVVLTVADLQGLEYIRAQTPEYLRLIEVGTLRTFLQETRIVTSLFAGTVCVATYWIGQFIGRMIAIRPIGKWFNLTSDGSDDDERSRQREALAP